jgi:hypothetical protein
MITSTTIQYTLAIGLPVVIITIWIVLFECIIKREKSKKEGNE